MKTKSTTIIAVRKGGTVCLAGDGQVTLGPTIMKGSARKVRQIAGGKVIAGFAGGAADGIALLERLETKMEQVGGNFARATVELAKDWRMDKALRQLDAVLLVSDGTAIFLLSGNGDVIEPDEDIIAIGSGGPYALAAARMLLKHTDLGAEAVAREALGAAADICIYTNTTITALTLGRN